MRVDVRTFLNRGRTTRQGCTQGLDTERKKRCAIGERYQKQISPSTVTYVHSVLKSALEHAVREDEPPRNIARNIKTSAARLRSFQPFTAAEARQLISFHDLRHSTATLLLEQGVDLDVIKENSGQALRHPVQPATRPDSTTATNHTLCSIHPPTLPSRRPEAPPEQFRRGLLISLPQGLRNPLLQPQHNRF
ncbi:hypothetical protein BBN63_21255 [Streptomyces niveus]|uniref:Tyr recombinase domain-containing protein n=1 Tax=Streptomyces niveus TaxID=193462 RepID=A0A1U9QVU1_STRNV|nr:hypothetical protein BBN63_21255 [Streptomyces niveus]